MNSSIFMQQESSILDVSKNFNRSGIKDNHDGSRVMDLFAQVDALHMQDDGDGDLDELAAFDMRMDKQSSTERENEDSYHVTQKERLFNESFDRDSDLLDDKDLLEFKIAQDIIAQCKLESGKKLTFNKSLAKSYGKGSNPPSYLSSPCVEDLESYTFNERNFKRDNDQLKRVSDLQSEAFTEEQQINELTTPQ